MRKLHKVEKTGKHCQYKRLGPSPQYRFGLADVGLQILDYKNKPRVVLFLPEGNDRYFYSRHVMGPGDVRMLIGWLARYLAMADPTQLSLSIASTKAHAKLIAHEQDKIAAELGLQPKETK